MKHVYVLRMKLKDSRRFFRKSDCVDNCENLSSVQNESFFLIGKKKRKSLHT